MALLVPSVDFSIVSGGRVDFLSISISTSWWKFKVPRAWKNSIRGGVKASVSSSIRDLQVLRRQFPAPAIPSTAEFLPKQSNEDEEKQNCYVKPGYGIRTLREELLELFYREFSLSGSVFSKCFSTKCQITGGVRGGVAIDQCSDIQPRLRALESQCKDRLSFVKRRDVLGKIIGVSSFFINPFEAEGAGLPPEERPKLCDDACEKELENVPMVTTKSGLQYKDIKVGRGPSPPVGFQVAANYVAMVPSGQIFDSSLEKGQVYLFRVGSGQVIKGLDEGILSMKTGGKRRLYIPGPLAFPKGLSSAPGRPRVAPNSPVVFDVSLEYIPGLEAEEE